MGKKKRHKKQVRRQEDTKVIKWVILFMIGLYMLSYIWPILLWAGAGYGIYRLVNRQLKLGKARTALRLETLKGAIGRADRQLHLLDDCLNKKDYAQYNLIARQLLPQLDTVKTETDSLQAAMTGDLYLRITNKIQQETTAIRQQLEQLTLSPDHGELNEEELSMLKLAPELLSSYRNIRMDDHVIRQKIATSDNRAELTALHDANMNRFEDILKGYLKIKASPKDFHKAHERLAQAKAAIEQFDLELDNTLRELNEDDLNDFDISLRLMSKKEDL